MRTKCTTVTFENPFTIGESERELPAGTYAVETDEELLEGPSFQAYRRTQCRLQISENQTDQKGTSLTLVIDPHELDLALQRDKLVKKVITHNPT